VKYFVLIFLIAVALVVGIAGKRGLPSRTPPIEVFSDMDRQPKIRPQTPSDFLRRWQVLAPPGSGDGRARFAFPR
jgi:hypothetical protein